MSGCEKNNSASILTYLTVWHACILWRLTVTLLTTWTWTLPLVWVLDSIRRNNFALVLSNWQQGQRTKALSEVEKKRGEKLNRKNCACGWPQARLSQERFLSAQHIHIDTVIAKAILQKGTRGSFHHRAKDDYDLVVTMLQKPHSLGGFGLTPSVIVAVYVEVAMTFRFL